MTALSVQSEAPHSVRTRGISNVQLTPMGYEKSSFKLFISLDNLG